MTKQDDKKYVVFKIAKGMVKTNPDILGELCVRKDDGITAVIDEDQKIAWKCYHEKLLNTEVAWKRKS